MSGSNFCATYKNIIENMIAELSNKIKNSKNDALKSDMLILEKDFIKSSNSNTIGDKSFYNIRKRLNVIMDVIEDMESALKENSRSKRKRLSRS